MVGHRMAAVDAQFYWMSAKVPNDDFALYAFGGEPVDLERAIERVLRRARACPELGLRVDDGSALTYPRWVPTAVGPEYVVCHDLADQSWHGNVGVVTTLIARAAFDPAKTVAMLCGPEIMMRFAAVDLAKAGVPPEAIHLSMERNMKCAIGRCGHCQFSSDFVCKDGPVATWARLGRLIQLREI